VIDSAPEIVLLAVDFDEDLIEMPSPLLALSQGLRALLPDLGCEHRAEPVPPMAHAFMADVDPTFVEQVFDIPQRKWKSDIHHHCKTDDFWRRIEVAKWVLGHATDTKVSAGWPQAGLV